MDSPHARFTAAIRDADAEDGEDLLRFELASWAVRQGVVVLRAASRMFNGDDEVGLRLDESWPVQASETGLRARIARGVHSYAGCLLVVEPIPAPAG